VSGQLDFAYPWWISYGHLILALLVAGLLLLGRTRRWSRWPMLLLAIVALWSAAAFVVARFVLNLNGRASLPTQAFLASGIGRVLDMGAGTGRSSIMVLEARPQTTLVALDLFGESWEHHFGHDARPQDRLLANLRAANVDKRAAIQSGDMRKLPFEAETFDAIVSAYAIDHLNGEGIRQSLSEASRVLKPRGEFLLMVIAKDPWLKFAFGPLLAHAGMRGSDWWTGRVAEAGFEVTEHGLRPGTLYVLARKGSGGAAPRAARGSQPRLVRINSLRSSSV
jgi:ubiquinone/menaquinone biosynthesis C-methylase UbiE